MSLTVKIRRGEGPFWGTLKATARAILHFHVPVGSLTRPLFRLLYSLHVAGREGLGWGLRFFWYEPLFRSQCVAIGPHFQMEQLPYITGKGRIILGAGVRLSGKPSVGFSNRFETLPELSIGDGTFVAHLCGFHIARKVSIGKHCLLAGGVRVFDCDAHPYDAALRRNNAPFPPENSKPVTIGDDVWIGADAVILKGVTIGDRSIVAAGSIVTRDVAADVVVAGNPARVVKHLSTTI